MAMNAQPFYTGSVRAPFVPGSGFVRPAVFPISAAVVPRNLPGPIWPGQGPGRWHVGPAVGGGMPAYTVAGSYGAAEGIPGQGAGWMGTVMMGAMIGGATGFVVPDSSPTVGAIIGGIVAVVTRILS